MRTSPDSNSSNAVGTSQTKRLSIVLLLNLLMIAGLVIAGLRAHSLGLLAAGGDFVADSLALILGLFAVHLRDRHGRTHAPTYVAALNGGFLLVVTILVLVAAADRLLHQSPEVHGLPMLIVSATSAVVMLIGAVILGRSARSEDLHMRSVLLDTLSDGLSAAAVAIVGGIIYFSGGLYWLDSVVAIVVGLVIGFGASRLLRDVAQALRTKTELSVDRD